jgi:hypothetical protein
MEDEGQAYIGLVILDLTVHANTNITSLFPVVRQTLKREPKDFFYLLNMCIFSAYFMHHKVFQAEEAFIF